MGGRGDVSRRASRDEREERRPSIGVSRRRNARRSRGSGPSETSRAMRRRETEMIQRRAAGGGRTDGQLSPRSTCRPLLGHCRVMCDTWNRKTVRSPSTSGRCCRERRWMASRGRVVGKSAYAQSRRRVDDNVDVHLESRSHAFNSTPLRCPRYRITCLTR